MGRKASSAPEILVGNVPRSNRGKPMRAVDESLWSTPGEVVELNDSYAVASDHLKVQVITDYGSARSESFSTGTTAPAGSETNV